MPQVGALPLFALGALFLLGIFPGRANSVAFYPSACLGGWDNAYRVEEEAGEAEGVIAKEVRDITDKKNG